MDVSLDGSTGGYAGRIEVLEGRSGRRFRSEAERARIAAESDRATAKDRTEAKREEAEAMKLLKLAEVEADLARINAQNARSEALAALEMERLRLEAMPGIVAQMVKPAEKIDSITIHQLGGLGARGQGAEVSGERSSPMSQIVDSILDLAVNAPTMHQLGEAISRQVAGAGADGTGKPAGGKSG